MEQTLTLLYSGFGSIPKPRGGDVRTEFIDDTVGTRPESVVNRRGIVVRRS